MPPDEKDRFGDKLRDAERAREDQFFAEQDRKLLDRIRASGAEQGAGSSLPAAALRCPRCARELRAQQLVGLYRDECPACGGTVKRSA